MSVDWAREIVWTFCLHKLDISYTTLSAMHTFCYVVVNRHGTLFSIENRAASRSGISPTRHC